MRVTKIKSQEIYSSMRIDGSFHLSHAVLFEKSIKERGYKPFSDFSDKIFTAGRSKRIYTQKELGYPYLSNSNVIAQNPFLNCKYNSKKYGYDESAFLKEGMILTGRVGAIAQTAYVTKEFEEKQAMGSDNIIRIVAKNSKISGFLYAFLSSNIGRTLLWKLATGGVQPYITEDMIANIPVPIFPAHKQEEIHNLIVESADLRVEANRLLEEAKFILKKEANLSDLTVDNYEYFGPRSNRNVSCFVKNNKSVDTTTINAFNHSKRISDTIHRVKAIIPTLPLEDFLDNKKFFSTGSFPRIEVEKGIKLINQSDIFDVIIKGKNISRRKVNTGNLTEYGEVLIAGVGTLGENETFCRVIFANEDLEGQLVSGEFIRMKTNEKVFSGYLFTWLSTDYGFRFIRSTHSGTKLCRPIQKLLLKIPVPILEKTIMENIHNMVTDAHTMRFQANNKESQAIHLIEKEIESWQQL